VAGNKESNGKSSNGNGNSDRVESNKEGNGEGRKSNGNDNKEGKGKGGKSNGRGDKDGKEEGDNMGNAYSNEGGRQATAATMVMATATMWAMAMESCLVLLSTLACVCLGLQLQGGYCKACNSNH
jgi:hypothetical protein